MRADFANILVDPRSGQRALRLEVFSHNDGHVIEGVLYADDGVWYPICSGVPCFLVGELRPDFSDFAQRRNLPPMATGDVVARDAEQKLTNITFSDKWRRFKRYGLEPEHQDFLFEWYRKKLGLGTAQELEEFYAGFNRILEVGPGSGFNTRFMAQHCGGTVYSVDISEAAHTTFENTQELENCLVVQADLMSTPFPDARFDFIIADGVLHHTPDTRAAVTALYHKLAPGGRFYFYVYRKMGAARQFTDAHIRQHFTRLEPQACYEACEAITALGRELSKLNVSITLDKAIDVLGIPAGTHNVQRLIYYNFMKCFWNDSFDFDTNNMVNFDWYHPHNAWQHDEQEIAGWLADLGVIDYTFNDSNPNGISVLLTKPKERRA